MIQCRDGEAGSAIYGARGPAYRLPTALPLRLGTPPCLPPALPVPLRLGLLSVYRSAKKGSIIAAFPTPPQNDNSECVFRNQKRASESRHTHRERPLGLAQASPNGLNTHDTQ